MSGASSGLSTTCPASATMPVRASLASTSAGGPDPGRCPSSSTGSSATASARQSCSTRSDGSCWRALTTRRQIPGNVGCMLRLVSVKIRSPASPHRRLRDIELLGPIQEPERDAHGTLVKRWTGDVVERDRGRDPAPLLAPTRDQTTADQPEATAFANTCEPLPPSRAKPTLMPNGAGRAVPLEGYWQIFTTVRRDPRCSS